jgi:hypothetical protein
MEPFRTGIIGSSMGQYIGADVCGFRGRMNCEDELAEKSSDGRAR